MTLLEIVEWVALPVNTLLLCLGSVVISAVVTSDNDYNNQTSYVIDKLCKY